uniref:Non-compact myelin associated protein n=1 Tax=Sphenodon punctatus TaxID=8508 RepID=A0A8D0HGW4_SPHPU
MTTAAPLSDVTLPSTNVTIKSRKQTLYQISGAIVAAIVVGVVVIFTVVLLLLKMYNRRLRAERELEPKTPKATMPSASGKNSNSVGHPTTVTIIPVDVHMQNR